MIEHDPMDENIPMLYPPSVLGIPESRYMNSEFASSLSFKICLLDLNCVMFSFLVMEFSRLIISRTRGNMGWDGKEKAGVEGGTLAL